MYLGGKFEMANWTKTFTIVAMLLIICRYMANSDHVEINPDVSPSEQIHVSGIQANVFI